MPLQATPYTLPLAVAGVAFAVLSVRLARRADSRDRSVRLAVPLFAATAVWTLGYAAELSVTTYHAQLLFARVQYLGNATVPLLWFAYVVSYAGYEDAVSRTWWAALAVPPVAVVVLAATYPSTELLWRSVEATTAPGGFEAIQTDHGPAFYAFITYVYALVFATTAFLARRIRTSTGVYRRQTAALLAGSLVPAFAGLVYVSGANPFPALNLPALAFVVTSAVVAWSVYRSDLFDLAPVAWETAVSQLEDPVFVVDDDDRLVGLNDAARSLTDANVGSTASDALDDVFDEPVWRQPGEHEFDVVADGDARVFQAAVTPIERGGVRRGVVVVLRDVTERHRRERRLDEFASVVSHDLRNPLNVAHGHLELGRETGDDQHFEEAEDALGRMERIIDDLLTFAREGAAVAGDETVSLENTARTAWATVDTMDADATLDVADDRTLVADETAVLRLLENLFRNSVEHGDNPMVTVGTNGTGFFVADDGPGIPESEREDVFEHGYTTSDDGTGFGLAIVEEVAATHGWTVSVGESDAGGARFEFGVE